METIRQQVDLADARFFAFHGYYPEEQVLGNEFFVTISVSFLRERGGNSEDLLNTVNYEQLYSIAKEEMEKPRKLLETVAETMLSTVVATFGFLEVALVKIVKMNPPFGGDTSKAVVTLMWTK